METLDLREIAGIEGLDYFETTPQMNGYPANIKGALKGFETFEHAQEVAHKYGLSIETFEKRDGWQLWCRTGNAAYNAFTNSATDYGDNYSDFDGGSIDEEAFLADEVLERISDFTSFDDLESFISSRRELFEEIEKAGVNQKIITCMGNYLETIEAESMCFYHDTRHYVIGLIDNN